MLPHLRFHILHRAAAEVPLTKMLTNISCLIPGTFCLAERKALCSRCRSHYTSPPSTPWPTGWRCWTGRASPTSSQSSQRSTDSRQPLLLGENRRLLRCYFLSSCKKKKKKTLNTSFLKVAKQGKLVGQGLLKFLASVGKPELALAFIQDPLSRWVRIQPEQSSKAYPTAQGFVWRKRPET